MTINFMNGFKFSDVLENYDPKTPCLAPCPDQYFAALKFDTEKNGKLK